MILSRRNLIATALLLPVIRRRAGAAPAAVPLDASEGSQTLTADGVLHSPIWGFGGQVPGPLLRLRLGEELRLRLVNHLQQPTSLHFQGVRMPNPMDGVAGLTQPPVQPGGSFEYRFSPPDAGTFWYRPATAPHVAEQKGRGLYGVLIVDEIDPPPVDRELIAVLDDWKLDADGRPAAFLDPDDVRGPGRIGPLVTLNSTPIPQTMRLPPGCRVRMRFLNACNARMVALLFEGLRPKIVAVDGQSCEAFEPARMMVPAAPGARFDLIFDMPRNGEPAAIKLRSIGFAVAAAATTGEPFLAFKTDGEPAADRGPVQGVPLNPALPPEIRLQHAKRLDITIARQADSEARRIWTLNGASWDGSPGKPMLSAKLGQPVTFGFINTTDVAHTIHIHGHVVRILHGLDDGWEPYWRDTVVVPPKRTVRVAFLADNPGSWLIESTVLEHAMGGLMSCFEVVT